MYYSRCQERHFNFFLGANNFFPMPPDYSKIGKKQYFICSNLTLFIVPFFLSSFLFFSIFLSFSFFSFSLGEGATAPSSPQMTPLVDAITKQADIYPGPKTDACFLQFELIVFRINLSNRQSDSVDIRVDVPTYEFILLQVF